jgi:hypothetical protein
MNFSKSFPNALSGTSCWRASPNNLQELCTTLSKLLVARQVHTKYVAAKLSRINTYKKGEGVASPLFPKWQHAPLPFSSVIIPPRPLRSFPERLPP